MIETGNASTASEESLTIKTAWADDSIAVGYIRPISAASLQERPVTVHAAIAENVAYKAWKDFGIPPLTTSLGQIGFATALEPILIYIPKAGSGDTVVNYRIEVGQQWCSRHPNDIIVRSTQKQHKPTTPSEWHRAVSAVKDIGEHILNRAGGAAADAVSAAVQQGVANFMRPPQPYAMVPQDVPFID